MSSTCKNKFFSYGNLIIHPWGHKSNAVPDDVNDIIRVGTQMARVIREAGGPEFTVGTGPDILCKSYI